LVLQYTQIREDLSFELRHFLFPSAGCLSSLANL
jgi:hypothetical protein